MEFSPAIPRAGQPIDRVREHLLLSLHLGRLRPGDRVPSVRRLAVIAGLNRKTVHRAYRALVEEGVLSVRPGAGTFVADAAGFAPLDRSEDDLIHTMNRCRAEAHGLGLTPAAFADFVQGALNGGLKGLPLAVVECNDEQIDMIGRDLHAGLAIDARRIPLDAVLADPAGTLRGLWGVVTTDCHRVEVERAARTIGARVYRVALDPEFPRRILRTARARGIVLCVRDLRFATVFRRFLGQLGATEEQLAHLRIVTPRRLRGAIREAGADAEILISPLAEKDAAAHAPPFVRRVKAHWRLADGTIDRLKAALAFDIARRREGRHA